MENRTEQYALVILAAGIGARFGQGVKQLTAVGSHGETLMEYSIDDLGVLALHTRIEELQTIDHAVTIMEVKEIVDEAIEHANKKNIKHFFDILMAKRYDDEDMIILRENDFM